MYKMIGPALVRQDTLEARSNVGKRLEFIGGASRGGLPARGMGMGDEGPAGWCSSCMLELKCALK